MTLYTAVLRTWMTLAPGAVMPDAHEVAQAIEYAVENDPKPVPFTATSMNNGSSKLRDAVLMAVYAERESHVQQHPKCLSWDCKAGLSCGVWQMPCRFVKAHDLRDQAVHWIEMFRGGRQACDLPGAIMCGHCRKAAPRRMATERWVTSYRIAKRLEEETVAEESLQHE